MMEEIERLLTQKEVSTRTGLGRVAIWRLEKQGGFPGRRRVSPGKIGWLASEIAAWITDRPEGQLLLRVSERRLESERTFAMTSTLPNRGHDHRVKTIKSRSSDLFLAVLPELNMWRQDARGWRSGLCPLPDHSERTPSFGVHLGMAIFNCFGCGARGDIFSLYQHLNRGCSFREAIHRLNLILGKS